MYDVLVIIMRRLTASRIYDQMCHACIYVRVSVCGTQRGHRAQAHRQRKRSRYPSDATFETHAHVANICAQKMCNQITRLTYVTE